MKRIALAIALAFALIFGYATVWSVADEMTSQSAEASETRNLLATVVKNPEGEDLGVIIDFVKDFQDRVVFAILIYGDYEKYGDSGRQVAIPFGALSCKEQNCLLNASKDRLDSAPTFISKDDLVPETKLAEDIYRYFGLQPYWTEEESPKPEMAPEYYWP